MHITPEENRHPNLEVALLSYGIPQEDDLGVEVAGALLLGSEVGLQISGLS